MEGLTVGGRALGIAPKDSISGSELLVLGTFDSFQGRTQ